MSLLRQVVEGYGQTESVAPATLTVQGEYRPEHVGPPLASNAIKLVDVPDMDYFAAQSELGKGARTCWGTGSLVSPLYGLLLRTE